MGWGGARSSEQGVNIGHLGGWNRLGVAGCENYQFNLRCVHSDLPVSMDVAFGFIPNKTSCFDLAHSEPCARRQAIAVVSIIARILEGSFLKSWLLRGLLQCLMQPPGGASAQRDDPRRLAGDVGLQARISTSSWTGSFSVVGAVLGIAGPLAASPASLHSVSASHPHPAA